MSVTMSLLILLAGLINSAQALPAGALDPAFGNNGKVTLDFFNSSDSGQDILMQPDGKIIQVGYAFSSGSVSFALVRYHFNGSLDTSFGTGGKVTTSFSGINDQGFEVALQPDGKIIVAGSSSINAPPDLADFAIARYNSNGTLDASFDMDGKVTTHFDIEDIGFALLVQPDGKIVVIGSSQTYNTPPTSTASVARYNSDGSLDSNFGMGGKVTTNFNVAYGRAHAGVLQPDGKIVIGGFANLAGTGSDFALARLNSDGSFDQSFGNSGFRTTDFSVGTADIIEDMVLQPDGKIIAVGRTSRQTVSDFGVARYDANGNLDATFGSGGIVITDFSFIGANDSDRPSAVALQANGRIVVAGSHLVGSQNDFALARYLSNGSLDTSFGVGGLLTTDFFNLSDFAREIVIQPDGKILVGGTAANTTNDFAVARYLATARTGINSDFDGDGKSDLAVFRPTDSGWYVLQSSNGSLRSQVFGTSTDRIVPGDYDGDGKTDVAVLRAGNWYILQSSDNAFRAQAFGLTNDLPAPGDYDGDGKTDLAVFRDGVWHILQSSDNSYRAQQFGAAGDKPVQGDYDGDGKYDVAVFRPANATWYVLQSSNDAFLATQFGVGTDRPVQGDYDGDARTDLAVYRPENGTWYVLQTTAGFRAEQFGTMTDTAVPADYDGDGKTDIAVFRNGTWYVRQSFNGAVHTLSFGSSGDYPVPAAYVP